MRNNKMSFFLMAFMGFMVVAILILTFLLAIRPEDAVNSTSMDSQSVVVQEGMSEDATTADTVEETTLSEDIAQEVSQDSLAVEVTMLRAKNTVNVRSQDSADSEKLGSLSKGEEVEFVEELASGWTKIKYNSVDAYVKSEYLEAVTK